MTNTINFNIRRCIFTIISTMAIFVGICYAKCSIADKEFLFDPYFFVVLPVLCGFAREIGFARKKMQTLN